MWHFEYNFGDYLDNAYLCFDFDRMEMYNGSVYNKIQINEESVIWKRESAFLGEKSENWYYFGKHVQIEILKAYKKYLISKVLKDKLNE